MFAYLCAVILTQKPTQKKTTMSRSGILKSSLAKKYWMAATGLFLCVFLVGHLLGNLQLFIAGPEGKLAFNEYAKFMTSNPAVNILSWVTYLSIVFHIVDAIVLSVNNKKARPQNYAYNKPGQNSAWNSRNMGILGSVILIFIIVHMSNFWAKMHFDEMPMQLLDSGESIKDLHKVVMDFFNPAINSLALAAVALYVIGQIGIFLHLHHGFQSAFQTVGVNHPRYNKIIRGLGLAFSVLVPLAFASIPVYLYIIQMA